MNLQDFESRVCNWIEKKELIHNGDVVLLAVSGGADSVALLRFFARVKETLGVRLYCVHVEHGIRKEASLADARFVQALCREMEIPCQVIAVGDEIKKIQDTHMSLEEKSRVVRYQVLNQSAEVLEKEWSSPVRIAVAHHGNDNAETMLFHLVRGTGLDGLRGMPAKRERVIRPFLMESRETVVAYLEALQQTYCTDATNEELVYSRNRLRHQVLPELQTVNEQALSHINQAAELVGEVADYVNQEATKILASARRDNPPANALGEIDTSVFERLPEFMRREVLHLWVQEYIPGAKDVCAIHIEAMDKLWKSQVGRQCHLPKGMRVYRTYDGMAIGIEDGQTHTECKSVLLPDLEKEKECQICFGDNVFLLRLFTKEVGQEIPTKSYTKWFDYDKIKSDIQIRQRACGDYFAINAQGDHKKLQDFFVNEKVPAEKRDEIPLLCEGNHVLWIVGYRISAKYKVDDTSERILEVQFLEEKKNERNN